MIFKCPTCGENHSVPTNYDNTEYICQNSSNRRTPKIFQNMQQDDLLSRSGYNYNKKSTLVNEKRPVTIIGITPYTNVSGEKIDNHRRAVNY